MGCSIHVTGSFLGSKGRLYKVSCGLPQNVPVQFLCRNSAGNGKARVHCILYISFAVERSWKLHFFRNNAKKVKVQFRVGEFNACYRKLLGVKWGVYEVMNLPRLS